MDKCSKINDRKFSIDEIEASKAYTEIFFERQQVNKDLLSKKENEMFEVNGRGPVGQLLNVISTLPEIRHEKVNRVRQEISCGSYDLTRGLDEAIDRVLEELISES